MLRKPEQKSDSFGSAFSIAILRLSWLESFPSSLNIGHNFLPCFFGFTITVRRRKAKGVVLCLVAIPLTVKNLPLIPAYTTATLDGLTPTDRPTQRPIPTAAQAGLIC